MVLRGKSAEFRHTEGEERQHQKTGGASSCNLSGARDQVKRCHQDESRQYWKNWSTRDDLRSLALWKETFGEGFVSLLVFAYQLY